MSEAHDSPVDDGAGEQVGTVGEEAAKLLGAVSEAMAAWESGRHDGEVGHDDGPGWSDGLADLAADAAEALRAPHLHGTDETADQATGTGRARAEDGSGACRWCPLCRAAHLVEETHPEVRVHLISAARSLLRATALVLEQVQGQPASDPRTPDPRTPGSRAQDRAARAAAGVEHIDLDDDGPGEAAPPNGPRGHDEETW